MSEVIHDTTVNRIAAPQSLCYQVRPKQIACKVELGYKLWAEQLAAALKLRGSSPTIREGVIR
jgi:hypothetical protein